MGQITVEKNVGGIEGLCVITPAVHGDERGYFMETYNANDMKEAGLNINFVQDNQSMSTKGVLRGLHFQKEFPQLKLVRVVRGCVFDVAVDVRPGSATFGKWYGVELSAENKKQFLIPRGFAHGFLVLSDEAEFCYKCDGFYHPNDEGGIAWNDPTIGIAWPNLTNIDGEYYLTDKTPIKMSEKDKKWLGLNTIFLNPDVSVIVPVYNDEQYIYECLKSLKNQTYYNFEVIIIDDGSTDNTSTICDTFAESDARFKVFHQNNKGVANSRNEGVNHAKGKYVMFVDGDDTVSSNFIRNSFNNAVKNNADIVVFRYNRFSQNGCLSDGPSDSFLGLKEKGEILDNLYEIRNYMWNKLYKRSLFNDVEFIPVKVYEEHAVLHKLIYKSNNIYISSDVLYNYLIRNDSLISNLTPDTDNIRFEMVENKVHDLRSWGYSFAADKEELYSAYNYLLRNGKQGLHSKKATDIIKSIRIPLNNYTRNQKIMIWFARHNLTVFELMIKLFNRR